MGAIKTVSGGILSLPASTLAYSSEVFVDNGAPELAIEYMTSLAEEDQNTGPVQFTLAKAYYASGEAVMACESRDRALDIARLAGGFDQGNMEYRFALFQEDGFVCD